MTPSGKGNFAQCEDCAFYNTTKNKKYPCEYSHNVIRANIMDFNMGLVCYKFKLKDNYEQKSYTLRNGFS